MVRFADLCVFIRADCRNEEGVMERHGRESESVDAESAQGA